MNVYEIIGTLVGGGVLITIVSVAVFMERRFTRLETIVEILVDRMRLMEGQVTQILMHPSSPDKDVLLSKLRQGSIKVKEMRELKACLDVEFVHEKSDVKKLALAIMVADLETEIKLAEVLRTNKRKQDKVC